MRLIGFTPFPITELRVTLPFSRRMTTLRLIEVYDKFRLYVLPIFLLEKLRICIIRLITQILIDILLVYIIQVFVEN